MCRKLICLLTFIVLLGISSIGRAELVAQYKLDEGGGTIALDASGNGNDGTLEDDPAVVDGQFVQALEFEGSRVAIGASDSLTADFFQGSFTLTAWINPKRTGNTWQQVFRAITANATNDTLFLNNDGRLSWRGTVNGAWAGGMCETAADVVPADQWTHVGVTGDGTNFRIYVNGALSQESAFQTTDGENTTYYIGGTAGSESYSGMVDDLRIYNHVLSEADIRSSMENQGGAIVKSYGPDPKNGAIYADTWVSLSWKAGDLAVSHDVYFGENFDDVNDGIGDSFRVNQAATYFVVGFPGFPYPDGLVPGTTYYWRIDDVNDAEPNSPWKGDVWSFWIPPKKAYEPVPADGSINIAAEAVNLSWTAGFGAKLHTVYFGDDFDTVAGGTGGRQLSLPNYTTDPLEVDKTYYWRIDQFDGTAIHTGDVWSFTTRPEIAISDPNLLGWWKLDEGMGDIVLDWSGHDNHGTLTNGPVWVEGNDGGALQFDGSNDYVNLGTPAELYIPDNYTYSAWFRVGENINGDSDAQYLLCIGSRSDLVFGVEDNVGIDGDLALHYYDTAPGFNSLNVGKTVWSSGDWHMVAGTKDSTGHKIYLDGELKNSDTNTRDDNYATTRMISIGAMGWNNDEYYNGAIDDVRIYNRALTGDEIKQIMRGDLFVAWDPSPAKGATPDLDMALPLTWSPGDNASQHDVYFGTDGDAVANADTSTADVYRGRQSGTSYTPPEGVEWGGGPYYWRIDEYNTDGTISKGRVWRFTVADYILVEDFESYDAGDNQIWYSWLRR